MRLVGASYHAYGRACSAGHVVAHHSVLDSLSISARASSIVGSSPVPMADNALLIAALDAGAYVGCIALQKSGDSACRRSDLIISPTLVLPVPSSPRITSEVPPFFVRPLKDLGEPADDPFEKLLVASADVVLEVGQGPRAVPTLRLYGEATP